MRTFIFWGLASILLAPLSGCGESKKTAARNDNPQPAPVAKPEAATGAGGSKTTPSGQSNPAAEAPDSASATAAVQSAGAAPAAVEIQWVPPGALAAVYVRPRPLLSDPAMASIDPKIFLDSFAQEFGFPASDLEQALALFIEVHHEGSGEGHEEIHVATKMRFAKPYGGEAFLKKAITRAEPEKVEVAGKVYYRPFTKIGHAPTRGPSIHFVDDRTLIYGEREAVEAVLRDGGKAGPLEPLLQKLDASADLCVMATNLGRLVKQDQRYELGPMYEFVQFAYSLNAPESAYAAANCRSREDGRLHLGADREKDKASADKTLEFVSSLSLQKLVSCKICSVAWAAKQPGIEAADVGIRGPQAGQGRGGIPAASDEQRSFPEH